MTPNEWFSKRYWATIKEEFDHETLFVLHDLESYHLLMEELENSLCDKEECFINISYIINENEMGAPLERHIELNNMDIENLYTYMRGRL